MTSYEIFGIALAAIFTSGLLYVMWRIAKTIREE
jgi:hypothetical protein